MTSRLASTVAFCATALVTALAAATIATTAHAESPTIDTTPHGTSTLTRAQVQSELMQNRDEARALSSEWAMQYNAPAAPQSTLTRAQVRAEFIASRDEARALASEDSGAAYLAQAASHMPQPTLLAEQSAR